MKLTWYGHSAFRIETSGATILIDPYLIGNPSWTGGWEGPAEGVTHVLLTHGHNDHVSGAVEVLKKSGAQLVANYEICMYLVGQGVDGNKTNPGNLGGTVDCGAFTATFVQALHSSSFGLDGGQNVYLGNPGGLVLHFSDDKTLYHMGDTDIFSDMALIAEIHEPKVAMVPIGDRFTMSPVTAALAVKRFLKADAVIPCHYGSFPIIEPNADKFVAEMKGHATRVIVPEKGKAFSV